MHTIKQYVVFLLCLGMFLSSATARVTAIDSKTMSTEETLKAPETLVGEVKQKRDVHVKTFLTSDFRYQAYIYPNAVHYQNNGQFEEIDNRLVESKDDVALIENTANAFKVKFAKNTNANKIVSFTAESLGFSWGFVGLNKTFVSFDNNEKNRSNAITDISNTQTTVVYSDAFFNTDLQYVLVGNEIKENFILKDKGAPTSFTQTISIQQGSVSEENGKIVFKDKDGVTQYEMGQLMMSDAAGEFSDQVTFSVVKTSQGIDLTITADSEWIRDPARVYPITIDPSIQTSLDKALIEDVHVSSGMPGTYFGGHYIVKSGYGSTSKINYTYLKFALPALSASDLVVSATLEMYVRDSSVSDPTNIQVNVYEVTSAWAENTTTWNNKPTNNSIIEDYEMVSAAEWVTWDVTKVAKKWYTTDVNNGLLIKNNVENAIYKEYYAADTSSTYLAYRPNVVITYVNTNGLEDLWTYTSQIMGRAGVAFINNSTGNLTLMREDLSIAGGKMPVGITSFYNYDAKATGARFSWKTNYEQTITPLTIGSTSYYKYIDGDGTAIYFYSSSGQWIDELGKGLVLTINTNSTTARYVIKDKRDNKLEFNDSGLLVKLKDNSETPNSVSITHVSGRIDTVTDSSGRVFDYGYDTANRLTQIEYKGSDNVTKRTVTYAYVDTSSTKTLTVTYPDLKSVTYTYDSEYKIIKSEDIDHSTVEFSYFGSPKIMESVTEHATDGTTLGNRFIFDYTQYETMITDKYDQDVFYQFDNHGRTIGIKDINNAAQYYEYGASGGSQNKLTSVSKLQTTTVNLAKNISFESASDWAQSDTLGLLTTPIYSTTDKLFGTKSLSITHNGAIGRVIKAYENIPISLTQETSFTVSAYVKSTAAGVAHVGLVGGSATCVEFAVDEANVWQRIFATITIPQTVTSLQIQLVVDGAATVYFDGVQLEEGLGVNRYNLVENPSLEHVSGTLPNGWTATNMTGSDGSTSATSAFNSKSYLVNGNALSDKSLSQTITLSGNAGDVFSFGGWAKANAAPKKSDRSFQVTLTFNNTDSTTTVVSVPFNNPSTAWQYAEGKAVATKAYSSVKISFDYKKQLNTVTFDGAQVYREAFGQTFSYDANGNLLSAKDLEGNTDLTTYDQSNQLLRQVNADGTYVAYDYDNFQRVTAAQSSTGVATKITYDQFGNPRSTSISSDVFMKKLIAYYDFDGNDEDKSGNNHDATYNNGTYVSGKVGSALRFNGSNQYAELGLFKVPDNFSVSMWVKNERIVANESLIGKHTDAGADQLVLGQYSSKLTANIGGTSVDFDTKTLGYQFLVAIYTKVNATTTHLTVYNNAVKVYDADLAGVIGDTSTGKPWTLGMEWDSSTTKSDFFQGSIDELAFYEGALDEQEIETLYKQANTKQLIAKYDFTNASGSSVPDVTNNGHHATVVGGATFANGQLVLNGSTGYMQLDDFTIGNSLSVAMTVKADVVKNAALFAKHTATGSNILVSGYYGGWEMNIRGNIKNQGTMLANTSYTVVYTIDQINTTQSVIQAYVNGSPIYPANYTVNVLLGDTSGKAWVIGQEWDSSTASDFFDGTIDNIQIYNYALSADEVSANAAALTNGTYNPATPVNPITWDKRITSSATYTTDGNYITSVTDSRGNTANYSYDTTFGRLDTFRAPGEAESEATTYSYESNTDRLKKVEKIVDGKTYTNSYTYDLDQLTKISHNGFDYEFTYDIFGNPHQIKVAGTTLITNSYLVNNGLLDTLTYGNGAVVDYDYDSDHRLVAKRINSVLKYEYAYDHQGNLARTVEHNGTSTVTTTYVYDFLNRLTKMVSSNGNTLNYHYDTYGRVDVLTNRLGTSTYTHSYVYGDATKEGEIPGLIYTVKLNGSTRLSYDFDPLARLSSRTIATTTPFTTTYTYLDGAGSHSTTTLLASLTNGSNPAYSYTYDANGNIRTIKEGSTTQAEYFYDTMNQLIREDSAYSSKSIDYVYDIGGNLTSKTIYTLTGGVRGAQEDSIVYLYENAWKDQLSSYDGQSITYDAIGNPLSYRDGLSFTWANGRELAGVTNNGVTGTFTYNDSGIRTSKTYNEVTTSYLLNGSSIVRQTQGESTLDFFYDENGNLYGFQKGTSTYYYLRNGQNDIVGILDSNGNQVVSYTYDAWGNQLSVSGTLATTIGVENPFRYRGYYFDTETGLYYLNSRYYDSVIGRFINADSLVTASTTLLGTNMYAYCESNPVLRLDIGGGFWESIFDVLSLGASIIEVALNPADPWAWAGLVGDTVDLIPFVTGVGEVTRAVKITTEVVDQSDNVLDAAKVLRKSAEASTGSYEVLYKSGSRYVGKGGFDRAIRSAAEKATKYTDEVVSISWKSAPNDAAAFIDEYYMQLRNVNKEFKSYNKIWSPGKRLLGQ